MTPHTQAYYAVIPAPVRYSTAVPDGAKLLFAEITALCNERGYCWATNAYFAELYGKDERTISRWLSLLSQAGFIAYIVDSAGGNSRKIWLREVLPLPQQGVDKNVVRGRQKCREGVDKNVVTLTTKMSTRIIKENNKREYSTTTPSARVEKGEEQAAPPPFNAAEKIAEQATPAAAPGPQDIEQMLANDPAVLEAFVRSAGITDRSKMPGYCAGFVAQITAEGKTHATRADLVKHFINWSRIRNQVEVSQAQKAALPPTPGQKSDSTYRSQTNKDNQHELLRHVLSNRQNQYTD